MREVEWQISESPVGYPDAVTAMEERVAAIRDGQAAELVWLLEHPPLYTAGTSAREEDLLAPERFPVYRSGRGGQYTYHGPGQRVAYVLLDLKARGRMDVRCYVNDLETWIIRSLARLGVKGERREGRIGIWVVSDNGIEEKIAAIGVRVRRWVTYHGIAVNVAPALEHFGGIVPCGIDGYGVTSLKKLRISARLTDFDAALRQEFEAIFSKAANPKAAISSGDSPAL